MFGKTLLQVLAFACAVLCAQAVELVGKVTVRETNRPPTMKLILNGGEKVALTRLDGKFSVDNVKPGTYSLEVGSNGWVFPLYTLTVEDNGKIRASFYNIRKQLVELSHPLHLEPLAKPAYFEPRKQMNIAAMFMNPMGLMMLFMVVTVFILPKMMDGMDPEEMKKLQEEMKKNQAGQPDPQKMIQGLFGGGGDGNDSDSD